MRQDGQSAENPSRKQEGPAQEGAQGCPGVREGCASEVGQSGAQSTESRCQRLIYVENAVKIKSPFLIVCRTTNDIESFLQTTYGFPNASIGILFSATREGSIHRTYFNGIIPASLDTVYTRLVLLKHPPL